VTCPLPAFRPQGDRFAATLAATGAPEALAGPLPKKTPPPDAVGLLYDATRCIGCQACVVKCKEANGLPPDSGTPRGPCTTPRTT